jgi:hypothetical protein
MLERILFFLFFDVKDNFFSIRSACECILLLLWQVRLVTFKLVLKLLYDDALGMFFFEAEYHLEEHSGTEADQ